MNAALTADSAKRKTIPIATGCLDYFPAALAAVAELSRIGNEKHNPGEPLHHARGKSSDHADCIIRHLADRGTIGDDGVRHSTSVAWRALALLQEELEREEGAPLPRGARAPKRFREVCSLCELPRMKDRIGQESVCFAADIIPVLRAIPT